MDLLELIRDRLVKHAHEREKPATIHEAVGTVRSAVAEFAKREELTNLLEARDETKRWSVAVRITKQRFTFVALRPDGSEASLGDLQTAMREACRPS
jgi:hypothetical protein